MIAFFSVTFICFFFYIFLFVVVLKHPRTTGTNFATFSTVMRPFFVFSIIILARKHDQGLGLLWSPNLDFATLLCCEMKGGNGGC